MKTTIITGIVTLVIGIGLGGFVFQGNNTPLGANVRAETYTVKDPTEVPKAVRRVTKSETVVVETDYTLLEVMDNIKASEQKVSRLTKELAEAQAELAKWQTLETRLNTELNKR